MITLDELLKGVDYKSLPSAHQENLKTLLFRINKVRTLLGKPMKVTSGYRSMVDHLRIYKQKGITDQKKIPMQSKHLFGQAVDIADPNGELMTWCKSHNTELSQFGLWLENGTKGWVHFQCVPYGSFKLGGSIWFNP